MARGSSSQRLPARSRQVEHPVGVLQHALQPMLAEDDGETEVLVEVPEGDQHLFGCLRVELEVGSSSTSTSGCSASTEAIATRCFSPPERESIRRRRRWAMVI